MSNFKTIGLTHYQPPRRKPYIPVPYQFSEERLKLPTGNENITCLPPEGDVVVHNVVNGSLADTNFSQNNRTVRTIAYHGEKQTNGTFGAISKLTLGGRERIYNGTAALDFFAGPFPVTIKQSITKGQLIGVTGTVGDGSLVFTKHVPCKLPHDSYGGGGDCVIWADVATIAGTDTDAHLSGLARVKGKIVRVLCLSVLDSGGYMPAKLDLKAGEAKVFTHAIECGVLDPFNANNPGTRVHVESNSNIEADFTFTAPGQSVTAKIYLGLVIESEGSSNSLQNFCS